MESVMHELDYIFYPRSIAIVGVSANQSKFGGGDWLKVIQKLGFKGKLYPVNPKLTRYSGLKVYASIKEIPENVDLTMVSIPSRFIPQLIDLQKRNRNSAYCFGFLFANEK